MNQQRRNHFTSEPEPGPGPDLDPGPATDFVPLPGHGGQGGGSGPSPYRFDKLREDAWDRFLEKSTDLAASHYANRGTALERECGWQIALWIRLFRWLLAVLKGSAKAEPPQPNPAARDSDRPAPPNQSSQPDQSHRSARSGQPDPDTDPTTDRTADPAHRVGRVERARRTAFATRSTRLAAAVRGAQRARIETESASGGAGTCPDPDRQHSDSRTESRTESIGAHLFGGAAWA